MSIDLLPAISAHCVVSVHWREKEKEGSTRTGRLAQSERGETWQANTCTHSTWHLLTHSYSLTHSLTLGPEGQRCGQTPVKIGRKRCFRVSCPPDSEYSCQNTTGDFFLQGNFCWSGLDDLAGHKLACLLGWWSFTATRFHWPLNAIAAAMEPLTLLSHHVQKQSKVVQFHFIHYLAWLIGSIGLPARKRDRVPLSVSHSVGDWIAHLNCLPANRKNYC